MSSRHLAESTRHLAEHARGLLALAGQTDRVESWGARLAAALLGGARLLTAGNGGSAAEAQHLVTELVGRYRQERAPLSAIALTTDSSSLTAIANDYGWSEALARQVHAHGRRGDVLIALSTSGESANVLAAVRAAKTIGVRTWALTGAAPNPLYRLCDEALAFPGSTPVVQEMHLVVIHLLCDAVDAIAAADVGRHLPEAG
ncbi:MAG TPA: SIS domain-containing protein [Candidatus Dormibacteraeota bacterium]|nr:SIS domain-containing protein [Candidatus Dormibacteraeota bacterium]